MDIVLTCRRICNTVYRYYTAHPGAPGLLPSAQRLTWQCTYYTSLPGSA